MGRTAANAPLVGTLAAMHAFGWTGMALQGGDVALPGDRLPGVLELRR